MLISTFQNFHSNKHEQQIYAHEAWWLNLWSKTLFKRQRASHVRLLSLNLQAHKTLHQSEAANYSTSIGILRNRPVNVKHLKQISSSILNFCRPDLSILSSMWLFIVFSLNALLGCHVWRSEAALKEGECEGKQFFSKLQEVILTRMFLRARAFNHLWNLFPLAN